MSLTARLREQNIDTSDLITAIKTEKNSADSIIITTKKYSRLVRLSWAFANTAVTSVENCEASLVGNE